MVTPEPAAYHGARRPAVPGSSLPGAAGACRAAVMLLRVRVVDTAAVEPVGIVTEVGLNEKEGPTKEVSSAEAVKTTVPVKPLAGVTAIVAVGWPLVTVIDWAGESEKVGQLMKVPLHLVEQRFYILLGN